MIFLAEVWRVHTSRSSHLSLAFFLPADIAAGSSEFVRRAEHLAGSALAGATCYVGGSITLLLSGRPALAAISGCNAVLIAAILPLLKRGVSLDLLANALIAISFPTLVGVTFLTGGEAATFMFGTAMVPLVGLLLTTRRAATVWTALTCLALASVGVLSVSGFEFPLASTWSPTAMAKLAGAILLVLVTFGITSAYDSAKRRADAAEAAARAHAQELGDRLCALEKRHLAAERDRLVTMAGGVADDFNNILTGVLGNAELIRTTSTDARSRGLAFEIDRALTRAASLTEQLLRFTGKSHRASEPLDIWEQARKAAAGLSCPVQFDFPSMPGFVAGDRTLLHDALAGVMLNAAQALDDADGKLTVTGARRSLTRAELSALISGEECDEGEYCSLTVFDNGCGIEASRLGQVFDPFYTTKPSSRGLGMSALLGIVQMHSGALGISSELDAGTSVELLFPIARPPTFAGSVPRRRNSAKKTTTRVLVVDDETAILHVVVRALEARGFEICTAADGGEALEFFRSESRDVDVVLLDYSMPGLDGIQVARLMRDIDPTVRIVLTSGYPEHEAACFDADGLFDGFVAKPYRADQLVAVLRDSG